MLVCLNQETYACSCFPFSSGTEFLNAKEVYRGKLVRAEPGEPNRVNYYFDVYHTYKGDKVKTLKLVYVDTDCARPFEVGGDYLIYAEDRVPQRYCNRTGLISYFKEDIEHLDRFETEKPLLMIRGFISGLPDELESKVRLKIRSPDGEREIKLDENRQFKQIVNKKQIYTVVINFPGRAEIELRDGNMMFEGKVHYSIEKKETVLEYDVDLAQTFADFREIRIGIPIQENKLRSA